MDATEFDRQALQRLPLAEACFLTLQTILQPDDLARLYDLHRGRTYQRELTFELFVSLLRDALVGQHGSARPTLLDALERGELNVSLKAFYDKLGRMPSAVSCALLAHAYDKLQPLLPDTIISPLPTTFASFTVVAIDGKVVKHVPRRLRPLRLDSESACKLLGGKGLVAINLATGLPLDIWAELDGEAGEGTLWRPLLDRLRDRVPRLLVVADRGFGMFSYARDVLEVGGQFVLRRHGQAVFVPDPERPAQHTTDCHGRALIDESGWLVRGKQQEDRLAVRRITLVREGGNLEWVTSLTDAAAHPASEVAELYRSRWDAEVVFGEITEVFGLRRLIGTRPEAGLFQMSFCLMLLGVVRVVRHYLAWSKGLPAEKVSGEKLWQDVREELSAALRLIRVDVLSKLVLCGSLAETIRDRLSDLLRGCWKRVWMKAQGKRRDPTCGSGKKVRLKQKKGHDSVYRIVKRAKQSMK